MYQNVSVVSVFVSVVCWLVSLELTAADSVRSRANAKFALEVSGSTACIKIVNYQILKPCVYLTSDIASCNRGM